MRGMKQILRPLTTLALAFGPALAHAQVPSDVDSGMVHRADAPETGVNADTLPDASDAGLAGAPGGGDMNCDGIVSVGDIGAFVLALTNPAGYAASYPGCDIDNADINGDGVVSVGDIGPFVGRLTAITTYVTNGCLVITGTDAPMHLTLRLRAGSPNELELDLGNDGVADQRFVRNPFNCIRVDALGGNDIIRIDDSNGVFTDLEITTINGGEGDDQLFGGSGAETLNGGPGADFVDGQQGSDVAFLGEGNDTFQWDPGDGSDIVEGEQGDDVLVFNGSGGAEIFSFSANGPRLRFTRNLGNIVMDVAGVEEFELRALGGADSATVNDLAATDVDRVEIDLANTLGGSGGDGQPDVVIVNGTAGDDSIDVLGSGTSATVVGASAQVDIIQSEGANDSLVVNGLAGDDGISATTLPGNVIKLTLDGGNDDDTLLGSLGADVMLGGAGIDFLFGDNGNDVALMGEGSDVFQWDPGDGSDTIEGQGGVDTMIFFGSNAAENINVLANGARVSFTRDVGSITMDMDGVEKVEFRALGGIDNVTVSDLSGTEATNVKVDLRGPNGGGDGAADSVTVAGTNGADVFGAHGDAGGVGVFGVQAAVEISFAEAAADRLTLNALGGDDVIDATSLEADGILLTINAGLGNDVLLGSEGSDQLNGGDGDDLALMGAGDDSFVWNPGDDNDTLEGQAGFDRMIFNGANVAELVTIAANGGRVIFSRSVASVIMDLNDVEGIDFAALGGSDSVTVQDLSGTDVTEINVKLESAAGGAAGDGQADNVIITGTSGDDVVLLAGDGSGTSVLGLAAQVNITGAESAIDRVTVNALAGDDAVDGSGLAAGAIQLTADGGNDNDVLIGGDGSDVLLGGNGDDVLIGGPGVDTLDGGAGDNVVIQ